MILIHSLPTEPLRKMTLKDWLEGEGAIAWALGTMVLHMTRLQSLGPQILDLLVDRILISQAELKLDTLKGKERLI